MYVCIGGKTADRDIAHDETWHTTAITGIDSEGVVCTVNGPCAVRAILWKLLSVKGAGGPTLSDIRKFHEVVTAMAV